jgi:hypothetical protein
MGLSWLQPVIRQVVNEVDPGDVEPEAISGGKVAHHRLEKADRVFVDELKRKVSATLRAGHLVRPA